MTAEEYATNLQEKNSMEKELKRRCMIFQYEEKMYLADFFDIDRKAMESLSFQAYTDTEAAFTKLKIKAEQDYHLMKSANPATLLGEIWSAYAKHHKAEWQEIRKIIKKDLINNK